LAARHFVRSDDRPLGRHHRLHLLDGRRGIKAGIAHGGTDEVGYKAVDSPHYYSDLHATILHQLGLNHKKMEVQSLGRTMRLVEEGDPIKESSPD
jgi:hypothetical protein